MRSPALGGALFLIVVSGVELGLGPYVLTGFEREWDSVPAGLAGAVVLGLGLGTVLRCVGALVRGGGTPSEVAPPTELVIEGPYQRVRHPMYLGTTLALLGEAVFLGQPILAVAAAVYIAALGSYGILVEDRRLAARFGTAHDDYVARTPPFLPRGRRG